MSNDRTRSQYQLTLTPGAYNTVAEATSLQDSDREGLAQLMLDAYRGTADDEGETMVEAREAIDFYLGNCSRDHSFVLKTEGAPTAMALVLEFRDQFWIDPVAVSAQHKRAGLGRRMVETCLASLTAAGVTEIGAAITDGNEPSERLFAGLGAQRVGPWPPAET